MNSAEPGSVSGGLSIDGDRAGGGGAAASNGHSNNSSDERDEPLTANFFLKRGYPVDIASDCAAKLSKEGCPSVRWLEFLTEEELVALMPRVIARYLLKTCTPSQHKHPACVSHTTATCSFISHRKVFVVALFSQRPLQSAAYR